METEDKAAVTFQQLLGEGRGHSSDTARSETPESMASVSSPRTGPALPISVMRPLRQSSGWMDTFPRALVPSVATFF